MYARVNIGQNANNKFGGVKMLHTGGSMNNSDERIKEHSSLLRTFLSYILTGIFSALYILLGLWGLHGYFYTEGLNQILPSLILLIVSIGLGSWSSKWMVKVITRLK